MDSNLIIKNNEFPKFLNQLAIDLTNFILKNLISLLKLIINYLAKDMTLLLHAIKLLKNSLEQR